MGGNRKLKRPPFNELWWVASMRWCRAAGVRWPTAEPESPQEVALVTTHQLFVGVKRGSVHMETLNKNLGRASAIIGSTQTIPSTQGNEKAVSVWRLLFSCSRPPGWFNQAALLQCENGGWRGNTRFYIKSADDSLRLTLRSGGGSSKRSFNSWEPFYLSAEPQRRTYAKSVKSGDLCGSEAFRCAAYKSDVACCGGRGQRAAVGLLHLDASRWGFFSYTQLQALNYP